MRRIIFYAVGIAMLIGFAASLQPLKAQVYGDFSAPTVRVVAYTEISNGTVLRADQFALPPTFTPTDHNDGYVKIPIGFNYEFDGEIYTELYVCINGFVTFSAPPYVAANNPRGLFTSSPSFPINVIAPFWGDHYYRTSVDQFQGYMPSEISYLSEPTKLTIQWKNLNINDPSIKSSVGNFQLILYKYVDPRSAQGQIEFAYGQIGGNPNTTQTDVVTRGASVGIKGEFTLQNDKSDFLNGLDFGKTSQVARTDETLTNEWTPSGGTDRRIVFTPVVQQNLEWWGDGDVDFSKAPGNKHDGLPQNRFVTVNDARLIIHSIASGIPLDSIRRRAAYHADVNHNGRYYYDNNNVRKDIPWRDANYAENLPSEINTIKRVFYQATENDAALILDYIGTKVPVLPWIYDTVIYHGKVSAEMQIADGITFGSAKAVDANTYQIPVYLNGYFNGPIGFKFNVNGVVTDVTSDLNTIKANDFSNNTVVFAATGEFDATSPLFTMTVVTDNPEMKISGLRFNDKETGSVKINLSAEDGSNGEILMQNEPNPVITTTNIALNIKEAGNYNLAIFDAMGNKVKTIYSGNLNAGSTNFTWNGTNDFGTNLSSGMYIYRLTGDNTTLSRKLMLAK